MAHCADELGADGFCKGLIALVRRLIHVHDLLTQNIQHSPSLGKRHLGMLLKLANEGELFFDHTKTLRLAE